MESGFRRLSVWKKAKDLAVAVYQISGEGALSRDFGLRDQMRRAAVSIASNIAEGEERDTNKDNMRFLFIAKGSLAELRTQLEIAREIKYISAEEYNILENNCAEIGRMLGGLIKAKSS